MRSNGHALLTALAAVALLSACAPPEPVRLGFIGGLSGRVADLGEAGRNGFLLAVEEANAKGGIGGRKIETLVRDDAQSADQARHATGELVAAKVAAIIGPVTSAMAEPVLAVATPAGIPVISPTVTTARLTGIDDLFLRVISDTNEYSALSARHHFQANGVRRVAAVFDVRNRAYTENWLAGFRSAFGGLGGTLTSETPFESGDAGDYRAMIANALREKPDALLIIASAVDTARIAQQLPERGSGPRLRLIGVEWAATERLIELGGVAVEGLAVTQYFDRNDRSPGYQQFQTTYETRFRSPPGFASIAAYDATRAVIEALSRGGKAPLKQTLIEGGPFSGAQQPVRFDRFGDARRDAFITVVRDGRFVRLD